MKRKQREPSMADPVSHDEMQRELQLLRSAIILIANEMGPHILSQDTGRRLGKLVAPPWDRDS